MAFEAGGDIHDKMTINLNYADNTVFKVNKNWLGSTVKDKKRLCCFVKSKILAYMQVQQFG